MKTKFYLSPARLAGMGAFFLILIAAFSSLSLSAQPLRLLEGQVADSKGLPLRGVSVILLNTSRGSFSDSAGRFHFGSLQPGNYHLHISAVGFSATDQWADLRQKDVHLAQIQLFESAEQLGSVMVTAEKTEALLQRTPVSISSLNTAQVAELQIWKSQDLTGVVPNFFSNNSGDQRNVASIRGITTTSYDPAVAVYIDGVNQFTLDTYLTQLFDVERIEVLRGPQGTLYGRNAMGGVINIITRPPSDHSEGFAETTFGNHNLERISLGLRDPLVKGKLYLGVAGMFEHLDGYYTNRYNNQPFDRQHSFAGNYYLKWMASDHWQFGLNVKHESNRNNGAFPLSGSVDEALHHPHTVNQNALTQLIDNTFNGSLSITHQGRAVNFMSQTAYQSNYRYYASPIDGDFSPYDAVTIVDNYGKPWNQVKVWTQEFKLSSSPLKNSPLGWTAGAYLFSQDNPSKQATHFGKDAALVGSPDSLYSILNTTQSTRKGLALYAQANYAFSERLRLIAGLRYDYEQDRQEVHGQYFVDGDPSPVFDTQADTSASTHYSAVSPKLGLESQLSGKSLLFLTYSRGFRVGGLTPLSSDPSQPPLHAYQPEFSNNFELGSKNTFLQNRLRLNLAVFYNILTDVQVPTLILPDAVTVIRNAGGLHSEGFEMEVSADPAKGLELAYNLGYTHAVYNQGSLSSNGQSIALSGKRQIFTPDLTSFLALQYGISLSRKSSLKLVLRGEWAYLGQQYFDLANSIAQSPYSLLNARLGVSSRHWSVFLWGKNLTGVNYIAYAYDFGAVHQGNPQTYGITLTGRLF